MGRRGKQQNMERSMKGKEKGLTAYLSPLGAWALAFGCSVGWGAFVMPGTTFLPVAGPLGTVIGIGIGGLIMLIIAVNYHYLMNCYPDEGGTYTYTKINFGYDHGFLGAWFLMLTYTAIIWANATALPLIARNLFGGLFQFGFHYQIANYQIYMGEVLISILALSIAALFCLRKKLAEKVQILMAVILFGGIALGIFAAVLSPNFGKQVFEPPFSPDQNSFVGVFTIIALAPWAYVGFESICHSAGEFSFSHKKSFRIMAGAVVMAAFSYAALAVLAVTVLPEGCGSWYEYISNLGSYSGIQGLPTFFSAESIFGSAGVIILGLTTFSGIITGLIGNFIASSRLLYKLSQDDMMPKFLGKLDENQTPKNAILFILCVSFILPFLGRTSTGWIVDVATVGATIAYTYVSASALKEARMRNDKKMMAAGGAGFLISVLFVMYFLIPNLLAVDTLSMESYLILSIWGILGLAYFLYLFNRDQNRRLGHSTFSWAVLVLLIVFTTSVWMRQSSEAAADKALNQSQAIVVAEAAQDKNASIDQLIAKEHTAVRKKINESFLYNSLLLVGMVALVLLLLFRIFSTMLKREKQIEAEKVLAEESSRAKTSFLSNMSHEIRTPMNAIIGLDNIALRDPDLAPHTREQLEKIGASAKHLLGLINDILDMSRIESGRMVLKEEEFAFRDFLDQINVIINGQCADKGLDYECQIIGHMNDYYIGDSMKLKQVLINILGNAVKFTNAPGNVTFTAEQIAAFAGYCTLRFVINDTGIGMSREYIPKIFEAFSQEDSQAANKYGSTGLGMAITKNIVEMMNGEIEVDSEKNVGTTFTVTVTMKTSSRSVRNDHADILPEGARMLVVDDDIVACEHAILVANAIGVSADYIMDAREALRSIQSEQEQGRPYQLVLTDYKMPEMDGIEFTRAIRTFDKGETIVIILSGYNWDDMHDEAKAAGADGILSKPLFTDSLLREIHTVMSNRDQSMDEAGTGDEQTEHAESENVLEGSHVLVAEDMDINAEILMDLLEIEGVTAERAENGQTAVDIFTNAPVDHFDAILMDVRMPVMDGLSATRAIRDLDRPDAKDVPIIAMTANAFDDDVQRSLQAGMTAHLSKPVEPDRLYETLTKLLKKK